MEIVAYSSALRDEVQRLNAKLAAAGSQWSLPTHERPANADDLAVWIETFVARDGDGVYGGYLLKNQTFFLDDEPIALGSLQMPLSLGEIEPAYAQIGVALLFDAIRRSPYLYSLGLGSTDTQFAKLLTAAQFRHVPVPFYFNVKSPNKFSREIRLPPEKGSLEKALRLLGRLRLADTAFGLRQRLRRPARSSAATPDMRVRELETLDDVGDRIFEANRDAYLLIGDRSSAALARSFPKDESRYIRLAVERRGKLVGWALALDTQMRQDKWFGDMRVGSLADCLAAPADAEAVVTAVDGYLSERGVDLVVSNQLHAAWCHALAAAGYERGPSNFFFYFSSELAGRLPPRDWEGRVHLNRGDGEGPGHL